MQTAAKSHTFRDARCGILATRRKGLRIESSRLVRSKRVGLAAPFTCKASSPAERQDGSTPALEATTTWASADRARIVEPPSTAAAGQPECLVVLINGFALSVEDYELWAQAMQANAAPHLRLWVALSAVDYSAAPKVEEQLFQQAADYVPHVLQKAISAGFNAQKAPSGRCDNMFAMMHSFAGIVFARSSMLQAGGCILLASDFTATSFTSRDALNIDTWSRPLLILQGELDGQMTWFRTVPYASEAAVWAAKLGPRHAAANRALVMVPGMTHAHTSSNTARTERGDLDLPDGYTASVQAGSETVANFLVAHMGADPASKEGAVDALLQQVLETASKMSGYAVQTGYGDIAALYKKASEPYTPQVALGGVLTHRPASVTQRVLSCLHPGEATAAERFAVEAQQWVAERLPAQARSRLRVVASVHTNVETFLYNQALMEPWDANTFTLHVHCLAFFATMDPLSDLALPRCLLPQAPEYWIKMKNCQALAQVLGVPGDFPDLPVSQLNQRTLQRALEALPAAMVTRYHQQGTPLVFAPDRDAIEEAKAAGLPPSPERFVREGRMLWRTDPATKAMTVSSPKVVAPPMGQPGSPSFRFSGVLYTKVLSVGGAMEWAALHSLRPVQPW